MGKRGPKPKPKALNILEGNPSRRELLPDDLDITPNLPAPKPQQVELDPVANAEWDRLMAAMPGHLYTAADVAILTIYVQSWSLFWQAQREIDENGVLIREIKETEHGTSETWKSNPALTAWRAATENLNKAADRLGLNPGVRAKMGVPKPRDEAGTVPASARAKLIAR